MLSNQWILGMEDNKVTCTQVAFMVFILPCPTYPGDERKDPLPLCSKPVADP